MHKLMLIKLVQSNIAVSGAKYDWVHCTKKHKFSKCDIILINWPIVDQLKMALLENVIISMPICIENS